jgi:hypothetical protein
MPGSNPDDASKRVPGMSGRGKTRLARAGFPLATSPSLHEGVTMGIYKDVYEFAASAGAFEGYVYSRENPDTERYPDWINNLVSQYASIPPEVRDEFQPSLDRTIGRALLSITPVLGEDHTLLQRLRTMIRSEIPRSPDDFEKEKQEKENWR